MAEGRQAEFEARVAAFLARALPDFEALVDATRLSSGASQETWRLDVRSGGRDTRYALRRAAGGADSPGTAGQAGLDTEALLCRAAGAAGVPVPDILASLAPQDGLGRGFLMPWLTGETLGARIVRDPAILSMEPSLAWQCGRVLARIHGIDPAGSGLDAHLVARTPAQLIDDTLAWYDGFGTAVPMIEYTAAWLRAHLPAGHRMTLVHGDFRTGNLMIDAQGLVAVLDWEIAHIGDPLRDLGWLCTRSWRFGAAHPVGGFGDYAALLDGYAAESGIRVAPEAVRFWEVFGSFWWAIGCLGMAWQYRHGPDRTVERAAIGRRASECLIDCVNLLIPGPASRSSPSAPGAPALPGAEELLESVAGFLRNDLPALPARTRYLARVAANSLDIVRRELGAGISAACDEHARLEHLLGCSAPLAVLRECVSRRLRRGEIRLDDPELKTHLRETALAAVLIDQPDYPGTHQALENAGIPPSPLPENPP